MSQEGIQQIKAEIRNILKQAAQFRELTGDEPLVVLASLATDMISEVRDDAVRTALIRDITKNLAGMVESVRRKPRWRLQ